VDLDPEDAKLVTLARSARARTGAAEGAAVRDETGRTYAAASVDLPSLSLTALQAAVAAALSSGAQQFEAAAVVSEAGKPDGADLRLLDDIGSPPLVRALPDGTVRR
jgi:cytidine deaminase